MSTNPPPIVPPLGEDNNDDGSQILGEDENQPLDPDLNPDRITSAEADERAATEGKLDGTDEA